MKSLRYRYTVLTVFNRWQHLERYLKWFEGLPVNWILLIDTETPMALRVGAAKGVMTFLYPRQEVFWKTFNHHLNCYAASGLTEDGTRYLILNDDDWWADGFLEEIDQHDGDFLLTTMRRGDVVAPGGHNHPTDTLWACPENLRVGRVGCEQAIVTGHLLKTMHWPDDLSGDGLAILELAARVPPQYVPQAVVLFNFLEPGRWRAP